MNEYQNILFTQSDYIGVITLNRPDIHNALDPRTWAEIRSVAGKIDFDRQIRVLVITGAGGQSFAAGSDVRSLSKRTTLELLKSEAHASLAKLESLAKPVIAAIDGFAIGGGCELALACDIRIATSRSKLGQPETGLGIIPGAGGTQRLQKIIGFAKAKEMILTGKIIDAYTAKKIGLLNIVVEHSRELMPEVYEIANKIATNNPLSVGLAKYIINTGVKLHSGQLLDRLAAVVGKAEIENK